jgi:hypothetical protein
MPDQMAVGANDDSIPELPLEIWDEVVIWNLYGPRPGAAQVPENREADAKRAYAGGGGLNGGLVKEKNRCEL